MNKPANLQVTVQVLVAAGSLTLLPSAALAATDDYRLLYGQATSSAKGTEDLVIDVLDPAFNTGYVYGGSALSTNGSIGVRALSNASEGRLSFSLYAEVGDLRNNIASGSFAGFAAPYPHDISANAWGVSIARWGDSFTLSGAYGTPVQMRARIELDASGGLSPAAVAGHIGNSLSYYVALPVVGAHTFSCVDRNSLCNVSQTFDFTLLSGTTHGVNADLTLSAYSAAVASYSPNQLPTSSDVSFSSRGRVFLDVLTPGYSYTMSSGLLLTSPIPEPPMAASMLAGLLLLVGRLARRGPQR